MLGVRAWVFGSVQICSGPWQRGGDAAWPQGPDGRAELAV
jgi:hypothetical protein